LRREFWSRRIPPYLCIGAGIFAVFWAHLSHSILARIEGKANLELSRFAKVLSIVLLRGAKLHP
jgi:hypothetical protein